MNSVIVSPFRRLPYVSIISVVSVMLTPSAVAQGVCTDYEYVTSSTWNSVQVVVIVVLSILVYVNAYLTFSRSRAMRKASAAPGALVTVTEGIPGSMCPHYAFVLPFLCLLLLVTFTMLVLASSGEYMELNGVVVTVLVILVLHVGNAFYITFAILRPMTGGLAVIPRTLPYLQGRIRRALVMIPIATTIHVLILGLVFPLALHTFCGPKKHDPPSDSDYLDDLVYTLSVACLVIGSGVGIISVLWTLFLYRLGIWTRSKSEPDLQDFNVLP